MELKQKIREEFESMMSSQGEWPQAIEKNADGGYRLKAAATAWETWQDAWEASRACLEVVMPSPQRDDGVKGDGYNMALSDCSAAIEAAGAKTK